MSEDAASLRLLSPDELIRRLLVYKTELENERSELEEYKSSSREIEEMLEKELEDEKRGAREKDRRIHMVETELTRCQERYDTEKKEMLKIENSLRKELESTKEDRDSKRKRVRDLEQQNDDLQRADRNNQQVMEDLGAKLNDAMERMTLLENEIADRQVASEEMYRLREELKERPRLVVCPLRIEKCEESDTPEEPTPDEKKTMMDDVDVEMASPEEILSTPENTESLQTLRTPLHLSAPVPQGKGFASCVNRIVNDLMIKVNRLENVLTDLRTKSPRSPRRT